MADDALLALAAELGAALKARGWMLTLAESCTGGLAAAAITEISGSSAWFDCGFVTYSNDAKRDMLSVSAQTLELHGAVSEQTALAMALGALAHSQAHIAAAITGIAGPDGGTPQKPVGMVCFAWVVRGQPEATTLHFAGNREAVRQQAVKTALEGILRLTLSTDL